MEQTTSYYFAFKELMFYYIDRTSATPYSFDSPFDRYDKTLPQALTGWAGTYKYLGSYVAENTDVMDVLNNSTIITLLSSYVLPKVWNKTAVISENETIDKTNVDINDFVNRVASYLFSSYPYFSKLITLFSDNESNLLAQVKSHGDIINKINDLPQTQFVSTDDHLSKLTDLTQDNATDADTIMARLDEIRNKLDNTYQRWSDEFIRKFAIM